MVVSAARAWPYVVTSVIRKRQKEKIKKERRKKKKRGVEETGVKGGEEQKEMDYLLSMGYFLHLDAVWISQFLLPRLCRCVWTETVGAYVVSNRRLKLLNLASFLHGTGAAVTYCQRI